MAAIINLYYIVYHTLILYVWITRLLVVVVSRSLVLFLSPFSFTMASRKTRTEGAQTAESSVSVNEALSRLGLTHEQFQAKQAELLSVLLQNQPFVPQNATTRNLPLYDKSKLEQSIDSRSRSSSVSSASSRAASPVVPRTPVKSNHVDIVPPRPRDQMELILEERNRRKEWQRRG